LVAAAAISRVRESDDLRLPWEGGLPEVIAASLEPYRDRLDDSYSPLCNEVDLAVARR